MQIVKQILSIKSEREHSNRTCPDFKLVHKKVNRCHIPATQQYELKIDRKGNDIDHHHQ